MENAETPAVRLALRLIGCLERADGDLLEELLHPDGRFAALTGGPAPLDRAGAVRVLVGLRDAPYRVTYGVPQAIDDHAVVIPGRLLTPISGGGEVLRQRVWLCTIRDGRIHRIIHRAREHDALVVYMREGPTLGMP